VSEGYHEQHSAVMCAAHIRHVSRSTLVSATGDEAITFPHAVLSLHCQCCPLTGPLQEFYFSTQSGSPAIGGFQCRLADQSVSCVTMVMWLKSSAQVSLGQQNFSAH
jgi:hypothetical protein